MTGASVSMNGPPSICGLSRLGVLRASLQLHRLREDLWQRRARSRRDHALSLR
jgi:hypothetical protein